MNQHYQDACIRTLQTRLDAAKNQQLQITQSLDLPPAPQALREQIESANLAPNLERLILFLFDHQGSRTDYISSSVAIGNVSDTWSRSASKHALESLGLQITCKLLPSVNRYGMATTIGHLWICPTKSNKHWQTLNDSKD